MAINDRSKKRLAVTQDDLGKQDSLRRNVLQKVTGEQYQSAIDALKAYKEVHPQFPEFKERAVRYLDYGVDLINGIKAKRSFPGIGNLPMNKQEELFARAHDHFEDLKLTIKRVEKVELDVRLADKRSTVWVLKALIHSATAIVLLGFMIEVSHGAIGTTEVVIDDALDKITTVVFKIIGM